VPRCTRLDQYWFGDAPQLIEQNHSKIRRVFLFTGENDEVAENTKKAGEMLKTAHIRVKVRIAPGMGHEVPADAMITNYRRPLRWLVGTHDGGGRALRDGLQARPDRRRQAREAREI